jgi:hypothetical protein
MSIAFALALDGIPGEQSRTIAIGDSQHCNHNQTREGEEERGGLRHSVSTSSRRHTATSNCCRQRVPAHLERIDQRSLKGWNRPRGRGSQRRERKASRLQGIEVG